MADFEEVYQLYGRTVYCFLLNLSRDPSLSEELTQETMVRAVLNISGFRGTCKMEVWLCQIAKNLYYEHCRKAGRSVPLEQAGPEPADSRDLAGELADKDMAQRILTVLHTLEEPYKEVFTLHALGDVPLKDISRLFGKSGSWARVTYYRAKAMIIVRLEENGHEAK